MPGKFEVYQDRSAKFRFRLKASNGVVVATGFEAYDDKAAVTEACYTVQEAVDGATTVDLDNAADNA